MTVAASYRGQCHCGAIGFVYATERPPKSWSVRACQRSFCRAHGAHYTSDANGSVSFRFSEPDDLVRYRFGLRTADFLFCRACGVFIGAVMSTENGAFAALNLNALVTPVQLPTSDPVFYDAESEDSRVARRETRWTPVVGTVE
jgi:hypothetical protein